MNSIASWFWLLMVVAVMVWYSTVVIYVAIRGGMDIKHMLARLKSKMDADDAAKCHNKPMAPRAD